MLIGKINAGKRQKILVTIREIKKIKMIDLRVYHTSEDGEMVATPPESLFLRIRWSR